MNSFVSQLEFSCLYLFSENLFQPVAVFGRMMDKPMVAAVLGVRHVFLSRRASDRRKLDSIVLNPYFQEFHYFIHGEWKSVILSVLCGSLARSLLRRSRVCWSRTLGLLFCC